MSSFRFHCPRSIGRALFAFIAALALLPANAAAQPPKPTMADVAYGVHARQKLDLYRPSTTAPGPLLFFIHGGGWMTGDKANPDFLAQCLRANIAVVSVNYRLQPDAIAAGVAPPVKACMDDVARALQFVRSKAREWSIDKRRIAGCGGSAGGFMALWLAFHPDMAVPTSDDPVARESTRLCCAVTFVPQTSLDPLQMRQWIPNNDYGHHAFSLASYQQFLDKREQLRPWIQRYSPYALASSGAPPVYLFYDTPLAMGQPYKDPPHSANFGAGLVEKLQRVGVEFEFNYPGAQGVKHPDIFSFITEKLAAPPAK